MKRRAEELVATGSKRPRGPEEDQGEAGHEEGDPEDLEAALVAESKANTKQHRVPGHNKAPHHERFTYSACPKVRQACAALLPIPQFGPQPGATRNEQRAGYRLVTQGACRGQLTPVTVLQKEHADRTGAWESHKQQTPERKRVPDRDRVRFELELKQRQQAARLAGQSAVQTGMKDVQDEHSAIEPCLPPSEPGRPVFNGPHRLHLQPGENAPEQMLLPGQEAAQSGSISVRRCRFVLSDNHDVVLPLITVSHRTTKL